MASRAWCFTLNNPVLGFHSHWGGIPYVQYFVYQYEIGEQNGTLHAQGYVYLSTKQRMTWLKKMLNAQACWSARRRSHEEASGYCKKDDTRAPGHLPYEWGVPPQQGRRTDMEALQADLDGPSPLEEIASNHFSAFLRYHKGIVLYRGLKGKKRSWHTHLTVYYGESGTGKSYRAAFEAGADAFVLSPPNVHGGAVWWDGYEGQENVVIDEFYGWIQHSLMLRLCDRLPINVKIHGGSVPFLAKRIWITSNKHPLEWWPKTGLGAMERRMTGDLGVVTHMAFGPGGAHWKPPALPAVENEEGDEDE